MSDPSLAKSELRVIEAQLLRAMGRCIADFSLVEPGDRVMVCLSGGKDSYSLLELLACHQRRAPFDFELLAVHLDQGQPGYDGAPLRAYLEASGVPFRILREDTYSVVKERVPEGKTYCSLCSRLRRGVLYNAAEALGCTKIALGHHRDDAIETLMLNLMFTGSLKSMPPKLVSDDQRNIVIRPLLYAAEETLAAYAQELQFPILPCDLCGSQEQLMRKQVKQWLSDLEAKAPRAKDSMLAALTNVKPTHLLDRDLWAKLGLHAAAESEPTKPVATRAKGHRLPIVS
jgi:tRNA 2-thiocytidine biosynthesis protein TtcA